MLNKIQQELLSLKNPKKVPLYQSFFKTGKGQYGEGDVFLGINMPTQRVIAKKYLNLSIGEVEQVLHSRIHEQRMVAVVIWTYQFEKADDETRKKIYDAYLRNTRWINNWDLVDVTTPRIVGIYQWKHPEERKVLYRFAKSVNLWERRIAILATSAFIRNNDFEDVLNISEILLTDKHDLIHKAVGWMLREVGKKDQSVEEKFLKKYYKTMPRTMLRYAIERFDEGKRKFYMRK
jgi:3-methyladenine DNA glycosylase AlkD